MREIEKFEVTALAKDSPWMKFFAFPKTGQLKPLLYGAPIEPNEYFSGFDALTAVVGPDAFAPISIKWTSACSDNVNTESFETTLLQHANVFAVSLKASPMVCEDIESALLKHGNRLIKMALRPVAVPLKNCYTFTLNTVSVFTDTETIAVVPVESETPLKTLSLQYYRGGPVSGARETLEGMLQGVHDRQTVVPERIDPPKIIPLKDVPTASERNDYVELCRTYHQLMAKK